MAENTRLKELSNDMKKLAEAMEKKYTELQTNFEHLEIDNQQRFERMELAVNKSEANFAQVRTMLEELKQEQFNGSSGSTPKMKSTIGFTPPPPTPPPRTPFQVRSIKLDFPRFDGSNVVGWIFKAEQFFDYYATPDAERITIASVHLDQEIVPWFQMMQKLQVFHCWNDFTAALETEFGPSPFDCPRSKLFKLTQSGTVAEYYLEFTALANRSEGVTRDALLDCFMGGLNDDIRRDVKSLTPVNIVKAVALAKLFEEKYQTQPKHKPNTYTPRPNFSQNTNKQPYTNTKPENSQNTQKPNSLPALLPTPATKQINNNQRTQQLKNMSPAEIQLRRDKGLCYFCDEKFSYTHKCPNKHQVLMLQMTDEEDELESNTDPPNTVVTQEHKPTDTEHHLSLNAMKGGTGMGTIRFTGTIGHITVQILLDGGSSESFLQPRVAQFLKLPIESANNFRVLIGNGQYMETEGKISELCVQVQGQELQLPVYLLPVVGADLILGSTWLATLGPHVADYAASSIKFLHKGNFITFQGEKSSQVTQAHFHQMKRMYSTDAISEFFTIQQVSPITPDDELKDLPTDIEPELATLLHTYRTVFDTPTGLPPSREKDHAIVLQANAQPVKTRPYRYPHSQKAQIEVMVQEMLDQGIIQLSNSPFSSPIVLVKKKDGNWRFCTDYRALNAITIKDSFPMPTVDELLDELYGAVYFSKLDLRAGYHQILLNPQDRHKTAFRTHHGHYEWLVMPFGLTNAPATFQCLMNQVFKNELRKFVLVFFDDILVYSSTWQSHLVHLELVLRTLQRHQLYARLSKCSFGLLEVDYLGHKVSGAGVAMDSNKVKTVMEWPTPKNVKQVRGFLGITGYYRRFIKNYAAIAGALTDLLKKDAFQWSEDSEKAFQQLKLAITSAPVLALPNFNEPFTIETDASGIGVGAVLSQQGHPIAYFSKKMVPRMQKQSAYTRELYAITEALAKFRHYLLGHQFIIKTDQKSLRSLLDQSLQTPEQQAWLHKFIGYDFKVEYKPGKENLAADALSRMFFMAWSEPQAHFLVELRAALMEDSELKKRMEQCLVEPRGTNDYLVRDGLLYWKNRLVIPNQSILVQKILNEFHTSPIGGHAGVTRSIARISAQFYWDKLRTDVQDFVKNCAICQQAKTSNLLPAGLLNPLPIPMQVWEDVAMDFITGLPMSHGFTVIMVVVDRLSKYAHFIAMKTDYTSNSVAEAFMNFIVKLHGIPKSIVSDRDKVFTSAFWQQLFKLQGTTLAMSSAYHPQTDGQSEVLNKCLEMYLRCFTFENPKNWFKSLAWAEFWYNSSFHTSAGMTPFKALYGRDPPTLTRHGYANNDSAEVVSQLTYRDLLLQQLRSNLHKAQERMKFQADKKRHDIEFMVGEMVLVKLQPYRQHSLALRRNQKLAMHYFGPFKITQRIGKVAYKLLLPSHAKIHDVFHISQLKKFHGTDSGPYLPLPLTTTEVGPLLQPKEILRTRVVLRGDTQVQQIQVLWEDGDATAATWEDFDDMKEHYPLFNLEDKIVAKGEGIVMHEAEPTARIEAPSRVSKRVRVPNTRLRGYVT